MTEQDRRTLRAECERRIRTVFIPIEHKNFLRTSDGMVYHRGIDGAITRFGRKAKGKAARRFDKMLRRAAREARAKLAGPARVPTTTCDAPTAAVQS